MKLFFAHADCGRVNKKLLESSDDDIINALVSLHKQQAHIVLGYELSYTGFLKRKKEPVLKNHQGKGGRCFLTMMRCLNPLREVVHGNDEVFEPTGHSGENANNVKPHCAKGHRLVTGRVKGEGGLMEE